MHYFSFVAKNLISWVLNNDFDPEMTLDVGNDLAFPFLRPCQAFHLNFVEFGLGPISSDFGYDMKIYSARN